MVLAFLRRVEFFLLKKCVCFGNGELGQAGRKLGPSALKTQHECTRGFYMI